MDKIKGVINNIEEIDKGLIEATQKRLDNLTKPLRSLGRLEELAKQLVGISEKERIEFKNKVIFTLAADHGVSEEGISAYPKEVTAQMVYNFLRGGAGINVLARHVGARVVVVDMGVAEEIPITKSQIPNKSQSPNSKLKIKKINFGTGNMVKGPAMTRDEAIKAIEAGIEAFEEEYKSGLPLNNDEAGIDIVGTGDMGIGNTTSSSAITACVTGAKIEDVTGRGTGLDDKGLRNKIQLIKRAIEINKPDSNNAIDILSKVGGFEIAGLVGVILVAVSKRVPVVIDGFISGAAALLSYKLEPKVKDYMIASHVSVEKGHKIILDYLGLKPLLNLDLRLGEGTGAALGINLCSAAVKILNEMATFENAGVSKETEK